MQQIKDLFGSIRILPKSSRRTERGDLVTDFTERVNLERGSLKPVSVSYVAYLLSPLSVSQLYMLLKKCNAADSFSAMFWYHAKPKKDA